MTLRVLKRDKKAVPQPLSEEIRDALPESAQEYLQKLEEELKKAKQEIEKLKGQLLMQSYNSSKPPSSDGLKKKAVIPAPRRSREQRPVRCLTCPRLRSVEHRREVKICLCCRSKVTAALPAGLKGAAAEYGPRIKSYAMFLMNQHLIPVRRVSEILMEMFGVEISIGSLMRWTAECSAGGKLESVS